MKKYLNICLILTFLCGCAKEYVALPEIAGDALSISASQIPFGANGNSTVVTRAFGIGDYYTEFSVGDHIGVFGVEKDGSGNPVHNNGQVKYHNLRFRLNNTGLWEQVDENDVIIANQLKADPNVEFFAYSPYFNEAELSATIETAGMLDQMVYFTSPENLKSNFYLWVKAEIQINESNNSFTYIRDEASYTLHDLLVTEAVTPTNNKLSFVFSHAMAMIALYYNDDASGLTVVNPMPLDCWRPTDPVDCEDPVTHEVRQEYTYRLLVIPGDDSQDVYGTVENRNVREDDGVNDPIDIVQTDFWQARVRPSANSLSLISISGSPIVDYESVGVDMGLPSATIWAKYNIGSRESKDTKWYQNNNTDDIESPLEFNRGYDRGDYYAWGELYTKYYKSGTVDANGNKVGGYYAGTYFDPNYTLAPVGGNSAGSRFDIVRSKLWKGEWRLPTDKDIDELIRYSTISIESVYYEDNLRYTRMADDWFDPTTAKEENDNIVTINGQKVARRFRVCVFKFVSKVNGNVVYFPGGGWSNFTIDQMRIASGHAGGMYYYSSDASFTETGKCSYLQIRAEESSSGFIAKVPYYPYVKKDTYYNVNINYPSDVMVGLNQQGSRYTAMQLRAVFGGNYAYENEAVSSSAKAGMRMRPTEVIVNP